MTGLSRKQLLAASIVVAAVLLGTLAMAVRPIFKHPGGTADIEFGQSSSSASSEKDPEYDEFESRSEDAPPSISVHVAGRVKQPGVYSLPAGSRVVDAVKAAGGAFPNSDLENVNLAEKLSDGEQVYIAPVGKAAPPVTSAVRGVPASRTSKQDAGEPARAREDGVDKLTNPGQGTININTAGVEELQKLPGIGPAMAQRIIDYRTEHGKFGSVDQLDEVRGIGPSKLEKLRAFVSL